MTDPNDDSDIGPEGVAPLSPPEHEHAPFNAVATFADAAAARDAIEALEKAGVDGADIALHGVETTTDDSQVDATTDAGPFGRTGFVAAVAGAIGTAVGAVIGVLILGDTVGTIPAALMGGIFIGGIAAVVGAARVIGIGRAWHDTFLELREGDVTVGVHTADAELAERAASVLESLESRATHRYRN